MQDYKLEDFKDWKLKIAGNDIFYLKINAKDDNAKTNNFIPVS